MAMWRGRYEIGFVAHAPAPMTEVVTSRQRRGTDGPPSTALGSGAEPGERGLLLGLTLVRPRRRCRRGRGHGAAGGRLRRLSQRIEGDRDRERRDHGEQGYEALHSDPPR